MTLPQKRQAKINL